MPIEKTSLFGLYRSSPFLSSLPQYPNSQLSLHPKNPKPQNPKTPYLYKNNLK